MHFKLRIACFSDNKKPIVHKQRAYAPLPTTNRDMHFHSGARNGTYVAILGLLMLAYTSCTVVPNHGGSTSVVKQIGGQSRGDRSDKAATCAHMDQLMNATGAAMKAVQCGTENTNEPAYCSILYVSGGCLCAYATPSACRETPSGCVPVTSCNCGVGGSC